MSTDTDRPDGEDTQVTRDDDIRVGTALLTLGVGLLGGVVVAAGGDHTARIVLVVASVGSLAVGARLLSGGDR